MSPEAFQAGIDDLQTALIRHKFLSDKNKSGGFDSNTRRAVERFQESNYLRVDGIVGGLTWAALTYPTLTRISEHCSKIDSSTKELQVILQKENFDIQIDGFFGRKTSRIVKKFQRRYGLEPDGICGPMTWSVLLGQRPKWDKNAPRRQLRLQLQTAFEQLAMVSAVHIGIYFSPLNVQNDLPFLHTFVTAYGLTCVTSPFLETMCIDRLDIARFPLLRFSPYVLAGFLSRQLLAWVLSLALK
ncbi:MAG: peptidoglycan-binding protein [Elainellaceae cyanobacterium]